MKKLLALVLALVMSLSLVTISNADFVDAKDVDLNEAVDVLSAVGVLVGDEKGNFNPKAELTREQAAKIIAYLDLGKDVAEALPSVKVFNDVAADRWSAKYIAYCVDQGYLAGVGEGNFDPAGKLTGYAFGKMLLCVLGYDASIELFTGASWQIKVASLMEKNDIADGVDGSASAALTREQAAQYALNALLAAYVEYENKGTDINLGTIGSITVGASAAKANTDGDKGAAKQLYEKLFSKLSTKPVSGDDFGRPAHQWTYKGEKIGVYADTADCVVIAEKDYDDALKLYVDVVDEDFEQGSDKYTTMVNGKADAKIKSGDVVEFFYQENADGVDVLRIAVVVRYSIGKVTDISTKVTKDDAKEGVESYITVKTLDEKTTLLNKGKDTDFAGFDYEEDDVILYVLSTKEQKVVLASQLAESVEGKVTAKKSDKIAIDGTYYKNVAGTIALKAEGTFYLNAADQVMAFDASVEKSGDYAYIYAVDASTDRGADGTFGKTATVYYVDQKGVKGSAVVADATFVDTSKSGLGTVTNGLTDNGYSAETSYVAYYDEEMKDMITTGVVAYKINSDGEFEKATAEFTVAKASGTVDVDKKDAEVTATANASSKTAFIFIENTGSKINTKVVEGYKNVNIDTTAPVWTVADDGDALYVFVYEKFTAVKSDAVAAVLLDTDCSSYENDDDDLVYDFTVAVDGEETLITVKDGSDALTKLSALKKGDAFTYELDDGFATSVTKITGNEKTYGDGVVAAANDDYIKVNGQKDADKGTIYTVTVEYKNAVLESDGSFVASKNVDKIDSVSVSEGGAIEQDDYVAYTLDDGNFDVIFVYEYIY